MLRIGYDVTPLVGDTTGVGTYTGQLLAHMLATGEHDFALLSNRPVAAQQFGGNGRVTVLADPFPSRLLWMQSVLPRRLGHSQLDLCHYTNSIGPLRSPCRYVVTIHDMTLSMLPRLHPRRKQFLIRPLIPLVARGAARVITVSNQARDDIMRLLRLPAERVAVIREAAAPNFRPAPAAEQARVRAAYGLNGPYVLYVGTLEPRKNLVRLIRAWRRLHERGVIAHRLVLVGTRGWRDRPIQREIEHAGTKIVVTGYVPGGDLPALYSAADAFVFPSLAEGFGLPVIEAMACGAPVLVSSVPALRELVADAALAVDPLDEQAIELEIERLLSDAALRAELRRRGLLRAAEFSWTEAARRTMELYRDVAACAV